MTVVNLKLEVPSDTEANTFLAAVREWCESHPGWGVTEVGRESAVCPECGKPMVWEPQLQTHVCHHAEE